MTGEQRAVWIERDGRRLYRFDQGDGPSIILLHGITNSGRAFAPQIAPLLDAGRRVVIPDLAGHGASGAVDRPYGIDDLVDDLLALAAELPDKPDLVGVSLGGMIALAAALRAPRNFGRLVVADSFAATTADAFHQMARAWGATLREKDGPLQVLDEAWPQMINKSFRSSGEGRRTWQVWQGVAATSDGSSIANVIDGIVGFDITDHLGAIDNEVLVIVGGDDRISPPEISHAIAAALPHGRPVEIAGAMHLSNVDAADRFNAAMLSFLAGSS